MERCRFQTPNSCVTKHIHKNADCSRKELPNFGRHPKLSCADQLLMTLTYWREYRTQFHIAGSYGVSAATVSRTIEKVKDALIGSKDFHLPGKKVLKSNDLEIEVLLVDAIERPKKSKKTL